MKLSALISQYPLLLGTWVLRSSNDMLIDKGVSYIIINYDDTIKFRTLYRDGFVGMKKSISGNILNITEYYDDTEAESSLYMSNNDRVVTPHIKEASCKYLIDINYSHINKYSYSIFGVEIPEFKSKTKYSKIERKINVSLHDKTLLIRDNKIPLYYLFDLQIGKVQQPFIETGINNFIFIQTFSFILNLIFAKILHNLIFIN